MSISQAYDKVKALLPEATVYRALGADSPQERPFVVITVSPTTIAFGKAHTVAVQIWLYAESYDWIDLKLPAIRDAFLADTSLGDVVWQGFSEDLYDDQFKCATRYVSFALPNSDG